MDIDFAVTREQPDGSFLEIPVIVEFTYTPAARGARGSCGEPLEPDEPEDFEFDSAHDLDGNEVELTNQEIEQATLSCFP